MKPALKKTLLIALAAVLLVGVSFVQGAMNRDRNTLGLTRVEPLENAPPVLAFTTMALGGFRGLISNALWIRANDLQDEDKFFEMAQLADWITKLEPHFVQVWLVQAWNMAYNISVKFKDYSDRWRWVQRGIALLRDDGLRYNPNETLIYRELAWFFQHKMGANLDDANMYYKQQWANDMAKVFAKKTPDLDELIDPKTDDQKERRKLLVETYKMDPALMKQVNERYGPLEWRLPEAHAIYWAAAGLEKAREHPEKVKRDDLITLRRVIYQSMQMSCQRGRLIANPYTKRFDFGPNLDIVGKVSDAYEQAAREDVANRDHILTAHRNFVRDAIYGLYSHNRLGEAARWFKYLAEKYPDKPIIDGDPTSIPSRVTLDQYAFSCLQVDVSETSRDKVVRAIQGLLLNSFESLAIGEDDRAAGFKLLAGKVWNTYQAAIGQDRKAAIGLAPLDTMQDDMLRRLLDPKEDLVPFEMRAVLRSKLGMPPEEAPKPAAPAVESGPVSNSQTNKTNP